ncbi:UNVERIFIED_CONTAM: hypothetical protein Scaly_1160900 [Sesamum calycinum]|uniref:Uncharacterized protein n=1 Tax=Sesamum calycinum TaxID=2727403 RepID=A0AAW2Q2Z8_9LAMI
MHNFLWKGNSDMGYARVAWNQDSWHALGSLIHCFPSGPQLMGASIVDTMSMIVLNGVAALALGTYGAHGFKPKNPSYKEVWHTASLYHLVHTAALVAAPMTKHPNIFGGLLTTGILAFSGTCYVVAYLEDRTYSRLAPFGGFAFIGAWASLLF